MPISKHFKNRGTKKVKDENRTALFRVCHKLNPLGEHQGSRNTTLIPCYSTDGHPEPCRGRTLDTELMRLFESARCHISQISHGSKSTIILSNKQVTDACMGIAGIIPAYS